MGFIYADILNLISSFTRDILPQSNVQVSSSSDAWSLFPFAGSHSGRIKQALKVRIAHHPSRRSAQSTGGVSAPQTAGRSILNRQPAKDQWASNMRTVLEKVGYHSKLLHKALNQLRAQEQHRRFQRIADLFKEVEQAEMEEEEANSRRRKVDMLLRQSHQSGLLDVNIEHSSMSASSLTASVDFDEAGRGPDDSRSDTLRAKREEYGRKASEAYRKKNQGYQKLMEEAGHIQCNVFMFTAFAVDGPEQQDFKVDRPTTVKQFADIVGSGFEAKVGVNSEAVQEPEKLFQL